MTKRRIFEDAPANNAGGGNIAGIGVGPKGEPGLTPRQMKKHKNRVMRRQPTIIKGAPDHLVSRLREARRQKQNVLECFLEHYSLPDDTSSSILLESISGLRISLKFK